MRTYHLIFFLFSHIEEVVLGAIGLIEATATCRSFDINDPSVVDLLISLRIFEALEHDHIDNRIRLSQLLFYSRKILVRLLAAR